MDSLALDHLKLEKSLHIAKSSKEVNDSMMEDLNQVRAELESSKVAYKAKLDALKAAYQAELEK